MTDIAYWDGELTSKMAELEQSIGTLKSLFGGDKEEVRAQEEAEGRERDGGRVELGVWCDGNEHGVGLASGMGGAASG